MGIHVFVGFDPREPLSFQVCKHSIIETSPGAVVHKLDTHKLRQEGLFSREWKITAEGQNIDIMDGKPFSTHFSYSRFLVPYLARKLNVGQHAIFMDSDMIVFSDINEVMHETSSAAGVSVVKHSFSDKEPVKMDGMRQENYNRKLWTAFMVFNLDNPYTRDLTPDAVNTKDGSFLHQLKWMPDNLIGSLSESWNWIPDHSEKADVPIKVLHMTRGTPELPLYRDTKYADLWHKALVRSMQ